MAGLIENPTAIALAWSLVHFLWQGGAIALTTVAIMRLGRLSASARYTTGIVALTAMLIAPIVTFVILIDAPPPVAQTVIGSSSVASASGIASFAPASNALASTGLSAPSIILIVWSCGVIVLSVRLLGGWMVARRMARRSLQPASQEVQVLARRVAARLALDRLVGVFESSAVAVPVMIGWLRPVVLLPAAAMSGLSMAQVEALLAHELAHVRRHDYLVNLLQSAVETLLFYHPAVWWVSRRVRVDREHCCDDLALAVCDRVVYARALTDLAALTVVPRVALAATDGPLLGRVRRILGQSGDHAPAGSAWMSALMAVLIVGSLVPSAMTAAREDERSIPQPSVVLVEQRTPAVPNGVPTGVPSDANRGVVTKLNSRARHEPVTDVSGGVAVTLDRQPQGTTAAAQAEREKARRAAEEAAAREQQLKANREQLDKMEVELAAKQINEKMRAAVQAFELRMAEAKEKYARANDAFQRGMISKDDAAKVEMEMQRIKQEYETVSRQFQLELEKFQTDRIKEQFVKNEEVYRRMLVEAQTERIAAILESQGRKLTERELAMARAEPVTSPTEQVRPADILIIEIHNEPDLPRAFVVQPDGTIRLPLMGPIKVQGQTTRQVQEAIGKKLASIGASSGVTVGLRRGVGK